MARLSDSQFPTETEYDRYVFFAAVNRIAASSCASSPEWRRRYISMARENNAKARKCREISTAKMRVAA